MKFSVLFLFLLLCTNSIAHHGFGGEYNRSEPIYLEGVVTKAYFGYPHADLVIDADETVDSPNLTDDAKEFKVGMRFWEAFLGTKIKVEFPPVQRFFSLGDKVKVGDKVALIVLRNCEKPHQLRGQWIRVASGDSIVRVGTMQREVDAC